MPVKTLAEARRHFEEALPYISTRYSAGIDRAEWQKPAAEAEPLFKEAMSKVIAEELRKKGILKVTDTEWRDLAKTKGAPIIETRIRAALDTWEANFGPIYEKIVKLVPTLPKRVIDFRTNINQRLVRVVEEWKKAAGKL